MAGITGIINELNDRANVTIDIPLNDGEERRLNCLLRKQQAPQFALFFPPGSLNPNELEPRMQCKLSVRHHDNIINLVAVIDEIKNDRTLILTARESMDPTSMREFFRVAINLPVRASFRPQSNQARMRAWVLEGTSVDLSGSGILCLFDQKPQSRNNIRLEIFLPDRTHPVICTAHVVRTYRLRKQRFQVAFHFDKIERKDSDLIISCCLQEQRRQLREKVRVD